MNQSSDILRAIKELARRENEYREALYEAVEAEHIYRKRKNQEILKAEGSEKVKVAQAELICEAEMKRKLKADATVTFLKDYLLDARTAISARQSILSAESRALGVTGSYTA